MNEHSKIQLSVLEMELVNNASWILTKNGILEKAKQLLFIIQENQQTYLQLQSPYIPPEILKTPPKISKGENYQGLPYLILDCPRSFDNQNIFAIRTMFWWGNFFSTTMHLAGVYKNSFTQKIIASYELLKETGFSICIQEDQWHHHFEKDNYVLVSMCSKRDFEHTINKGSFIKLANKIPLQQWNNAQESLLHYFKQIIEMLIV